MKKLIEKIMKKGYWKVVIRPQKFDMHRIADIESCVAVIKECQLQLRGWSYPHFDSKSGIAISGNDNIESYCDWEEGGYFEYWRFYQSGQFVHYFSIREDYGIREDKIREIQHWHATDSTKFLSILSTLYSVTEIFLFAQNLMSKNILGESTDIIIEIGDVENRELFFWNSFSRELNRNYICKFREENLIINRIVGKEELMSQAINLSLDACKEIFKKFGWEQVPMQVFVEDQKKFIERRI